MKTLILAILLSGCAAGQGITAVRTLDPGENPFGIAVCGEESPKAQEWGDIILTVLAKYTISQGFLDRETFEWAVNSSPINVCVVDKPQVCCNSTSCDGECKYVGDQYYCQRVAGCASWHSAWVSRDWPPICTEEWPDEPGCVNDPIRHHDWRVTLAHEIGNVIKLRALPDEKYWYESDGFHSTAYYAEGGPVALAKRHVVSMLLGVCR